MSMMFYQIFLYGHYIFVNYLTLADPGFWVLVITRGGLIGLAKMGPFATTNNFQICLSESQVLNILHKYFANFRVQSLLSFFDVLQSG